MLPLTCHTAWQPIAPPNFECFAIVCLQAVNTSDCEGLRVVGWHRWCRYGVAPHVVHVTFIQGDHDAKAARLREAGLWLLADDSYYSAPRNYISYENSVLQFISEVSQWANQTGRQMGWGRKHMLAGSYQVRCACFWLPVFLECPGVL